VLNITEELVLNITEELVLNITEDLVLNITEELVLNITEELVLNITEELVLNMAQVTASRLFVLKLNKRAKRENISYQKIRQTIHYSISNENIIAFKHLSC
jgi:hypothetical protein